MEMQRINTRTVEISHCAHILKANYLTRVHNTHFQVSIANFFISPLSKSFLINNIENESA